MTKEIKVMDIKQKLTMFNELWTPKIIGDLNDSHVKIAKLKGEFTWHDHENEDELFLVIKGNLLIKLRDKDLHIKEGEFVIIPKGMEHKPIAQEEVHVVLIEPKSTVSTGDIQEERTVVKANRI